MSIEIYIKVVKQYIHCLNAGDVNGIRALYSANAQLEDPVGSTVLQGIDTIAAFYKQGLQTGIVAKLSGEVCGTGREVAFPFELELTMDGKLTQISVIDVFRFDEEAKILSMRAFWGPDNCR